MGAFIGRRGRAPAEEAIHAVPDMAQSFPGRTLGPFPPPMPEFNNFQSLQLSNALCRPPASHEPAEFSSPIQEFHPGSTEPIHGYQPDRPTEPQTYGLVPVPRELPVADRVNNGASDSAFGQAVPAEPLPTPPLMVAGNSSAPPSPTLPAAQGSALPTLEPALEGKGNPNSSVAVKEATENSDQYDTSRPLCSLHLLCYRSGGRPPCRGQLITALKSRFPDEQSYEALVKEHVEYIVTDEKLFEQMRHVYETKMCGFFRQYLSLKSLRSLRLLSFTPTTRPTQVLLDDLVLQEVMYAYNHPSKISSGTQWVEWVFRLREADKRHAIEFVEHWNGTRIAIAGTIPWASSCMVGILWTSLGGDAQTAFTVAGFILSSLSFMLALLAVVSSIES
ncbi:hypothetical protein B0T14DRAFT_85145 [Immersiella caudata]|uniref:Uncharacterized protein n=1 Tax=Immersiella caudata TaxID=314043 RepID=A0AA40CE14_9PEZI|nr:hypothetical protein B0T14DRAFT_85145 [Immersiella caudata]